MRPAFIVGQYKCGTSWLLSILSAHPAVRALREIDVVRPLYDTTGRTPVPADAEERLAGFFGRSAWCPHDAETALQQLESREDPPTPRSIGGDGPFDDPPHSFADLHPQVGRKLVDEIGSAPDPAAALDAFLRATTADSNGEQWLVLKAADQIAVFDLLQGLCPQAPKIVITRDGRDAGLSALAYKELAADKPWFTGRQSYEELLRGWADRALRAWDHAQRGDIFVLRYEDLTRDFHGTLAPLLAWLDLDHDRGLIERIDAGTSFEAKTGRERGTPGTGILRSGVVGEWRSRLDEDDAEHAWEIAGTALQLMGYPRDGTVAPHPIGILAAEADLRLRLRYLDAPDDIVDTVNWYLRGRRAEAVTASDFWQSRLRAVQDELEQTTERLQGVQKQRNELAARRDELQSQRNELLDRLRTRTAAETEEAAAEPDPPPAAIDRSNGLRGLLVRLRGRVLASRRR